MNRVHRGFTLIELMVAITLIGLIAAIGVPNFQGFLMEKKVTESANLFLQAAQSARSEAIKINGRVALVKAPSTNEWCIIDRSVNATLATCDASTNAVGNGIVRKFLNGNQQTQGVTSPDNASMLTFNSFGQRVPNSDLSNPIDAMNFSMTDSSKQLRVTTTGGLRMCDPNRPSGDTQAC